jgi:hypothetical protein
MAALGYPAPSSNSLEQWPRSDQPYPHIRMATSDQSVSVGALPGVKGHLWGRADHYQAGIQALERVRRHSHLDEYPQKTSPLQSREISSNLGSLAKSSYGWPHDPHRWPAKLTTLAMSYPATQNSSKRLPFHSLFGEPRPDVCRPGAVHPTSGFP